MTKADLAENIRKKYEAETGKSSINPMWMDTEFTDAYTRWLENKIMEN